MQILLVLFAVSPNMHAPISYPLYALNGPGVEISSDKYVCKSFEVIVEVADRNERRPHKRLRENSPLPRGER